jgi:hypothetical protein
MEAKCIVTLSNHKFSILACCTMAMWLLCLTIKITHNVYMKYLQKMELKLLQLSALIQEEKFMLLLFINFPYYILKIFFHY